MELFEENTQVFTLRFWREPREAANADPLWRGVIIHLESGERTYIKDLSEIIAFISPYMAAMGTPVSEKQKRSILYWFLQALYKSLRE